MEDLASQKIGPERYLATMGAISLKVINQQILELLLNLKNLSFQAEREAARVVISSGQSVRPPPRSSVQVANDDDDQDSPDSMSETRPFSPGSSGDSSEAEPASIPVAFLVRPRAKIPKKRPICPNCSRGFQLAKLLHVKCSNCDR